MGCSKTAVRGWNINVPFVVFIEAVIVAIRSIRYSLFCLLIFDSADCIFFFVILYRRVEWSQIVDNAVSAFSFLFSLSLFLFSFFSLSSLSLSLLLSALPFSPSFCRYWGCVMMLIVMVVENNQVSTHMYVCVCTLLVDKHTQQQTKRVCGFFCTMIKTKQIFFFSSRMFRARRKRIAKLTFLVLSFAFFLYNANIYYHMHIYSQSKVMS